MEQPAKWSSLLINGAFQIKCAPDINGALHIIIYGGEKMVLTHMAPHNWMYIASPALGEESGFVFTGTYDIHELFLQCKDIHVLIR